MHPVQSPVGGDPADVPRLCPEVDFPMVGLVLAFKMEVQSITRSLLSKLEVSPTMPLGIEPQSASFLLPSLMQIFLLFG